MDDINLYEVFCGFYKNINAIPNFSSGAFLKNRIKSSSCETMQVLNALSVEDLLELVA